LDPLNTFVAISAIGATISYHISQVSIVTAGSDIKVNIKNPNGLEANFEFHI
jgi:hypothetical protein